MCLVVFGCMLFCLDMICEIVWVEILVSWVMLIWLGVWLFFG